MSSLILQRFSERIKKPKALTHPKEFLGPNTEKLLEFWSKLENMTRKQIRIVDRNFRDVYWKNHSEFFEAEVIAAKACMKVVDDYYALEASRAAEYLSCIVAYWATKEIIGGVENPTFLLMFNEKPNLFQRLIRWLKK